MNEYFAQTLASVLEETSTNMGNAMILEHLSTKGAVTLEEAEFYHTLCTDVITEAAEDFIPDTLEVPEQQEALAPIELFDAVGNKYVFQDGQLIPVADEAQAEEEMAPEVEPEMVPEEAPMVPEEEEALMAESTESEVVEESEEAVAETEVVEESEETVAETEGEVVEESTEEAEATIEESEVVEEELLEESDSVVARILANLK